MRRFNILLAVLLVSINAETFWQEGGSNMLWATGCDFPEGMSRVIKTTGDQCGESCARDAFCDHFVWVPSSGRDGECFLKSGYRKGLKAHPVESKRQVCGFRGDKAGGECRCR